MSAAQLGAPALSVGCATVLFAAIAGRLADESDHSAVLFISYGLIILTVVVLFKILGFVASPIMTLAAVQILRINTTLLPPEIRPAMWRRVALVICSLFYGTFFCIQLPTVIENLRAFASGF